MNAPRDYRDYLQDMLDASEKVTLFVRGLTLEQFLGDDKSQFAVIRGLEVIGEAAKKIPASFKAKHPQVAWREVAGMRDKLVHDYFGVNAQVVWRTVLEDVPRFAESIRQLLDL